MSSVYKARVNGHQATIRFSGESSNLNCEIVVSGRRGSYSRNFGLKGSPNEATYQHAIALMARHFNLRITNVART